MVGRDGRTLSEHWADGVRTLHGMHMRGFPNCFMMSVAQSGFTVNFPYVIDAQAKHLAYLVDRALGDGIRTLETSAEAESGWVESVLGFAGRTSEFGETCTPGYYNNEGQPTRKGRQGGFYFGGPREYFEILEAWRSDGTLEGLETTRGGAR